MRFKIDWASLIVGRKFPVFTFFTLYLRAISKYKIPRGLYLWGGGGGQFNGGFFALRLWGAYIWRGSYVEGLIFGILQYGTRKEQTGKKSFSMSTEINNMPFSSITQKTSTHEAAFT